MCVTRLVDFRAVQSLGANPEGRDFRIGFAVGARGIGASEVMAQTKFNDGSVKSAGTVAVTVVSK